MNIQRFFSGGGLAAFLVVGTLTLAACSGGGTSAGVGCRGYGGGGGSGTGANCGGHPNPSPTPSTASAQTVVVRLTGETAATDPTYGNILGYQLGSAGTTTQVVHLTANSTVQFVNMDATLPHTASFIQTWGGSYPSPFPPANLGPTASAAGTVISTANFSSGNINPGATSALYNTGGAATLIFGCAYHYDSNGMRTVVIVQ